MSEELFIRCCAPTMASIKTGNMFTCHFASQADMNHHIRMFNRRVRAKGLHVIPLRYTEGVGLIYVYRPSRLHQDLCSEKACSLLSERGYACCHPALCVQHLRKRLSQLNDFPHEIGLFLGYPPDDVEGFIHRRDEAKYTGHWKVYSDVESARRTFALYRKCTSAYLNQWTKGKSLERLTVPEPRQAHAPMAAA